MGEISETNLAKAIIKAYYEDRDVEKILSLVTDEIIWIGTEANDSAYGKEELRRLVDCNIQQFPDTFYIETEEPVINRLSDDISRIVIKGRNVELSKVMKKFVLSLTIVCVRQKDGRYLIDSMHASVPNIGLEKYNLEQELNETRQKEETLLAGIPGGVAIYRLKKDGRVATDFVSESLAKMCGYTVNEFLDYLRDNAQINLVSEEIPMIMESVGESLSNNKPVNISYHIYTKDKRKLFIRLDANVIQSAQLMDDDMAVLYAVHTPVSDESIKRRQEQKHYRDILDILGIAYWEWSRESGYYSSEKYSDYAISKEPHEQIWNIKETYKYIHPDDVEHYAEYVNTETNDTQRTSAIVRTKMNDGSYQWTEMFAFAETGKDKKVDRIISVMRRVDKEWIDQKERLNEALEVANQANQAKTDFLSRVSHDMRTPLNGILGLTTLLQDYVTDKKVLNDLGQLEQSGKYLLNLINDTLDVSKIESGKMELNPVVCDGRTTFNNILGLISPNMKEKQITFNIQAADLPFTMLYIDVGRVQQIVMNILGNAVKFTPVGGTISFSMSNISIENGIIKDKIVIEDNGIGISEEFLPYIFEPFSQERNTSTSNSKGTGLGMAITKQIIELMNGTVSVESKVGVGTKFTLILPMAMATDEQISEWHTDKREGRDTRLLEGKHILLCEDHPINLAIATRLLENKGMVVDAVENGRLGVEKFISSQAGYYDAILMDIRMPEMNGIDAARAIRNVGKSDARQVPIIAMTANALSSDIQETRNAGMDAHLSKPIETDKLYDVLLRLIKGRSKIVRSKVMIVDDIEVNRVVIKESIIADYDVVEANSGEEALQLLETEKGINAVITDIQMPGMDGIELVRKIRENNDYRHIAIIANTQYGEPAQEELLIELGANEFVYKPSTPKLIEMRLRNAINKM